MNWFLSFIDPAFLERDAGEARERLATMFYRFPRSRVSIAATPKTGRTSILTFLVDLENRLGAAEAGGNTPALGLDKRLKPFVVLEGSAIGDGELRLATVRDPADRIASCWLDKLVNGTAVWLAKYQSEDWFPEDFRTPEAIETSFLAFLGALRKDSEFFHSDPHWAPQSWMLRHWQATRCVTTGELADLPPTILGRLDLPAGLTPAPMPHKHRTEAWLKPYLLTPAARSLIGEIYSPDYDFLEKHGKKTAAYRDASPAGFEYHDALKLAAFDREVHLRRSRHLSRSLSAILKRAVWRHLVPADGQEA
jgi:hypothetical protein